MAFDRYTDICERISKRCRLQGWYGPEANKGTLLAPGYFDKNGLWHEPQEGVFGYRGYFDENGQLQSRAITHDPHTGFEFPPASEEQLRATEEALGISLLPMLRALYTQVANGGFGPDYGITGAQHGYYFGDDGRYMTVDQCTDTLPGIDYVDLRTYEQAQGDPVLIELPPKVWPAHFLHFCYWGCGEDVFLDGKSGRVYHVSAGDPQPEGYTGVFYRQETSLEDWLEDWLLGETSHWIDSGWRPIQDHESMKDEFP